MSAQSAQVIKLPRAPRIATERKCKTCGIIKPNAEFSRGARGHRQKCNACIAAPQIVTEQKCITCGVTKPVSEFHANPRMASGYKSKCKECANEHAREWHKTHPRGGFKNRPDKLKRLYGATYAEIVRALEAQHGLCANRACGQPISLEVSGVQKGRAVIDHSHARGHGHFRGLLCGGCNMKLGVLESDENLMLGLMEYLARTKETNTK